jgi:hypothetical protein
MSRRAQLCSGFPPGLRGCAYKPTSGRLAWPNRDPIGEEGGVNLYAFARNNAVGFWDVWGLHVYAVDVTAKSWIAEPITPGWVTGMNPANYPALLAAVAQVELLTSDNAVDDAINGRYRFLSQKTISIECCGSTIKSFNFSALFTDAGLEGGIFIPTAVVTDDRGYQATPSSLRFTWMVKGRPHPLAEPVVFWPVRYRTSVYIWHRIIGAIRCVNGKPSVSLKMMNSQFPSADAFYRIDGGPVTRAAAYGQKAMARLWDADPGDSTLVK